jgi:hypothetical protein
MQAIQTKYLSATNTRGSRIKAWCAAGSITLDYPYKFDEQMAHHHVADQLRIELGWIGENYGQLVGGALPDNKGYAWVLCPLVDAMGNLLQWAAGNRGTKEGNPYGVPEVKDALIALGRVNGCTSQPMDSADAYAIDFRSAS